MIPVESEPLMERLAVEVDEAKRLLLAACEREPTRVWDPRTLRATAGVSGSVAMIALCGLCNPEQDGRLELDARLQVRMPAA